VFKWLVTVDRLFFNQKFSIHFWENSWMSTLKVVTFISVHRPNLEPQATNVEGQEGLKQIFLSFCPDAKLIEKRMMLISFTFLVSNLRRLFCTWSGKESFFYLPPAINHIPILISWAEYATCNVYYATTFIWSSTRKLALIQISLYLFWICLYLVSLSLRLMFHANIWVFIETKAIHYWKYFPWYKLEVTQIHNFLLAWGTVL
jgi:hypothetical protein